MLVAQEPLGSAAASRACQDRLSMVQWGGAQVVAYDNDKLNQLGRRGLWRCRDSAAAQAVVVPSLALARQFARLARNTCQLVGPEIMSISIRPAAGRSSPS